MKAKILKVFFTLVEVGKFVLTTSVCLVNWDIQRTSKSNDLHSCVVSIILTFMPLITFFHAQLLIDKISNCIVFLKMKMSKAGLVFVPKPPNFAKMLNFKDTKMILEQLFELSYYLKLEKNVHKLPHLFFSHFDNLSST